MRCAAPEDDHVGGRLRRGLCERHYQRFMSTGSTAPPVYIDDLARFKIDPATGCHMWTGPKYRNGYGKTARKIHGTRLAHKAFYLASGRTIPDGLDLDHKCHDPLTCTGGWACPHRACVNPEHMKPETRAVNSRRGNQRGLKFDIEGICDRGHDLSDPANVRVISNGTRLCVPCWRIRYQAAGARYRARLKQETGRTRLLTGSPVSPGGLLSKDPQRLGPEQRRCDPGSADVHHGGGGAARGRVGGVPAGRGGRVGHVKVQREVLCFLFGGVAGE